MQAGIAFKTNRGMIIASYIQSEKQKQSEHTETTLK